jgi:hypothetical protein
VRSARIGGESQSASSRTSRAVIAGSIDTDAADKAAHFIQVCDSFHLPLVFLADNPGCWQGQASERAGIFRAGARMFAAQTRAQTVKVHVTLPKAYGFGSSVMAMNPYDEQTLSFGFPGRRSGPWVRRVPGTPSAPTTRPEPSCKQAENEIELSIGQRAELRRFDRPRDLRNVVIDRPCLVGARRRLAPLPAGRPHRHHALNPGVRVAATIRRLSGRSTLIAWMQ